MQKTPPTSSSKPSLGKKRVILLLACFFLAIFINAGLFFSLNYFKVKNVIVNNGEVSESLQGLDIFTNANILLLNEKSAEQDLYQRNSYIKAISVKKNFPDTVIVTATFWQPLCEMEVSEGFFTLSADGRILKKSTKKQSGLTKIHYYQKLSYTGYQTGDSVTFRDVKASLIFLQKAKDLGLAINSIDITGSNMIALKTDQQKLLFDVEKSQKDQLYQMDKVIRELKIQGKQFKTIDFRFDRVIIGE